MNSGGGDGRAPAVGLSDRPSVLRAEASTTQAWRREWLVAVVVFGTVALGLVSVFLLATALDIPQSRLARDPVAVTGAPWYIGSLSTLGVMVWAAGSAIAVLAGAVAERASRTRLLLEVGALGLVLSLDDAWLLHETARSTDRLHLDELIYATYAIVLVTILGRHRQVLLGPGALLFAAGLGFMAASVGSDIVGGPNFPEDCLKLMGITGWSAGLVLASWSTLRAEQVRLPPVPTA